MAVGIRIKLAGITEDQFDAVNKHVDPTGDPPHGLLFHASGPIDEGWGVIDFWESRQDFDVRAADRSRGGRRRRPAPRTPGYQAVRGSQDLHGLAPVRSLRRSPSYQLGSCVAA
jgi:hypothetical protein